MRSRSPDPVVASLATAGRTYEARSRDGRLSVLRIEGARPGHGVSYPAANAGSAAAWMLMAAVAPPPPVKRAFAGVEVERGQLQALEGTAPAWPPNGMLTVLTGGESEVIFGGNDGRLTLQNTPITTATVVANQLVYDPGSGIVQLPPPLMAARVTVPYRLIVGMTALLPALWLALSARGAWTARRVAHRKRGGLCADCGYDLRGTPGAARCPECGREQSAAQG
jgi:hypothetical protein